MQHGNKRILIIGGVAGGASCAARLRRLCERCEIVVIDKGEHVSFANCGLPYFVGDVIKEEQKLLVANPELFQNRFNIQVRVRHQATSINRTDNTVSITNLEDGSVTEMRYDALVLSTGSEAIRPPLEGIDLPGIYVLRTIPDSHKLKAAAKNAKRAVIIGGGFIGLEMAENLAGLGLEVTLIEMAKQLMPPLDAEMASYIKTCLEDNKIQLKLGCAVEAFSRTTEGLSVHYSDGHHVNTDIVLLAIGVTPASELAKQAGLEVGPRGGIKVDETMQTSDPDIWAVGDVVEVEDFISKQKLSVPLAGPANRQGRIAAGAILESFNPAIKRNLTFRGVQGTAVCQVFGLTIALSGASEKSLRRAGIDDYQKVYLHPGHHVSYFPGAQPIHLKLIYARDGKILGVQAIGRAGVTRRVDVIAMAIQMGATVYDLEESELCYAPQFGGAKDPVNLAGMIAANNLRHDLDLADWHLLHDDGHQLLDVRTDSEYQQGYIDDAINIPLEQLRQRLDELSADKELWLVCGVGQRAYYAVRLLMQQGFKVRVLSGGMQTYQAFANAGLLEAKNA
ncbi:FAD-dependent oxidoreductase [Methylomarinum sp. Ch1-1]|uniref:FAD-dependent oxidoreductase n=1 Tax=Methylomarinum roseum TaxID=3067653 RepID=A0AAU7NWP3_9GAMM|nr:FAD-dependent oxidoreductase [Methylomarinum sp. Ch1-1]MDP4522552.1 FAD-dependent oxidoreductase [Methylomarinum sp. Ch1-1]